MSNSKHLDRRTFLTLVSASVAGGSALGCVSGAIEAVDTGGKTSRPNVIFVFSDEHRWQSMSFTEMPEVHTPNMARLASQGLEMRQCISNYPVCSPYRGMLMTGQWPYQQGVIDNGITLSPGKNTISGSFQAAGYHTGYFGKWHLGGVALEEYGFDESSHWGNTNDHWHSTMLTTEGFVEREGYNATLMTDQAFDFVDRNKEMPFFLMLSLNPPHSDFTDAPEEELARYPEGSLPYRPNVPMDKEKPPRESNKIWDRTSWIYYRGYHAHITAVDRELGRILDRLDEQGLSDNTIVVYTSDHGSMFGSQGLGSKRQPYEESLRVPFLVRWPGHIEPNTRDTALFGAIDIMPTLCGLAGVEALTECAGHDFAPRILGESSEPTPASQFIMHIQKLNASNAKNHPAPLFRGVRTQRHTYAYLEDGSELLYDLEADPYQMNNLAAQPGFTVPAELKDALYDWLVQARDPYAMKFRMACVEAGYEDPLGE